MTFALFGARPAFEKPLPVGQLYFPAWERYEAAFQGIFARQYYTNQGPLTQQLEQELQQFLGVKHAICVSNATIGLMMVHDSMELSGKVILPSFTFAASAQSLSWAGLEPVFCDVDPDTHQIDIDRIGALIDKDVSAIMGVNLWGGACNPGALCALAENNGLHLYFDSAHAFGCTVDGIHVANFGRAEVFSFHATKILNATEGGCITTNDDELAARCRNIRSSYGAGKHVTVTKTANGRMSEAQAAIALMSLEDFPANQKNNAVLYQLYEEQLRAIPGLRLIKPSGVSFSNLQYLVCQVDELEFGLPRDMLVGILKAENVLARRYFYPGLHRTIPYISELPQYLNRLPNTDSLCASCIQFPIGALVSASDIERICGILMRAHRYSAEIRSWYEK
ncbi:MAG TPA: aminotransferase class I/II-fold pyridoxal phosphate-dependent enzyme [Ramlibacter sp.]|nr:aminotransferase class I/II-fold pyridoxal phosphate-dependent enzyme [Ramlibacter sp.]